MKSMTEYNPTNSRFFLLGFEALDMVKVLLNCKRLFLSTFHTSTSLDLGMFLRGRDNKDKYFFLGGVT